MRTSKADQVVGFFFLGDEIPEIFRNHGLFSNPLADSVKRHCTQYRRSDIRLHNKI